MTDLARPSNVRGSPSSQASPPVEPVRHGVGVQVDRLRSLGDGRVGAAKAITATARCGWACAVPTTSVMSGAIRSAWDKRQASRHTSTKLATGLSAVVAVRARRASAILRTAPASSRLTSPIPTRPPVNQLVARSVRSMGDAFCTKQQHVAGMVEVHQNAGVPIELALHVCGEPYSRSSDSWRPSTRRR